MPIEKKTTACSFIRNSQVGSHRKLTQNELWNGSIHLLIYLFTIKELVNIDYEALRELSGTLQKNSMPEVEKSKYSILQNTWLNWQIKTCHMFALKTPQD